MGSVRFGFNNALRERLDDSPEVKSLAGRATTIEDTDASRR